MLLYFLKVLSAAVFFQSLHQETLDSRDVYNTDYKI